MRYAKLILILACWASTIHAGGQVAALPEVGSQPFKSYAGGDFDHIELQNGNLYAQIPLVSFPQAGKLELDFSLVVNGTSWQLSGGCDGGGNCALNFQSAITMPTTSQGTYGGCLGADLPSQLFDSAIASVQLVLNQGLVVCPMQNAYTQTVECQGIGGPFPCWLYYNWNTFDVIDSSLATHPLAFDSADLTFLHDVEGTGYSLRIPAGAEYTHFDPDYAPVDFSNIVILESNGTQHTNSTTYDAYGNFTGWLSSIIDTNGNSIRHFLPFDPSSTSIFNGYVDSVGRKIPDFYNSQTNASVSLCPVTPWTEEPVISAKQWVVPGPNGQSNTYTFCYSQINISTNFFGNGAGGDLVGCGPAYYDDADGVWDECPSLQLREADASNVPVLQSVVLPNGTHWEFRYTTSMPSSSEAYGDLSDIVTPLGGSIHYDYATIPVCGPLPMGGDYGFPEKRAVVKRTESFLSGPSIVTKYTYQATTTTVSDANSSGNDTVHTFTLDHSNAPQECGASETSTQWYQGAQNTGTLLKEVDTSYASAPDPNLAGVTNALPPLTPYQEFSNRRPTNSVTTQNGTVVESKTYNYDYWYTVTVPWVAVSSDVYKEVAEPLACSNCVMYLNSATSVDDGIKTTTTHRYASDDPSFAARNIIAAPESITYTEDSSSAWVAQNVYTYDTAGNALYISSSTPDYSNSTGMTYNAQGMPTDTYDANLMAGLPNGDHVQMAYEPITGFDPVSNGQITYPGIFPYSVQHSTTGGIPHIEYFHYDSATGYPLWHTGENGSGANDPLHTVNYAYDVLGRLTSVLAPLTAAGRGSQTYCYVDYGVYGSACYGSTENTVYATTKASPDPDISKSYTYDGMGRQIQTAVYEGTSSIYTQIAYDNEGRVFQKWNPTRCYPSATPCAEESTWGITTYGYDGLGRKTSQTHPDGSTLTWQYFQNVVNSHDELEHPTQTSTDLLGRLTKVMEPDPVSGILALETDYAYDSFDDLLTVTQKGKNGDVARTRTFTYDAFPGRLMTSLNPETGSTPVTYSYDPNGNMLGKTDARSVTVKYTYDALSRVTSKYYVGAPAGSLPSCYLYDTSAGGIGKLAAEWTQASATCGSAAPATATPTKRIYMAYDAMGRILKEQQCVFTSCSVDTPAPCPNAISGQTYCYSLAGNLTWYAAGTASIPGVGKLSFTNTYDAAGRLGGMSSDWNDPIHPPSLFTGSPASGYMPSGMLNRWILGQNIFLTKTYDNRLRVTGETAVHP